MESMQATSGREDWCLKSENIEGVCHKPAAEENSKEKHCPKATTETTCICICCFQYAAPEQAIIKFADKEISSPSTYHGMLDQHWVDPFLSGPWQPPDFNQAIHHS